jgi:heat shock protein HtpX
VAVRGRGPVIFVWLVIVAVSIGYAALACLAAWAIGLPWWLGLVLPAVTLLTAERIRWMVKGAPIGVELQPCEPADYPAVHAILDRLCATSRQDKPMVRLIDWDEPNSLVFVEPGQRSTLCVTRGLVERLGNEHLEAVLAHEIAHIAHHDSRVMAIAEGLAGWDLLQPAALFMLLGKLDVKLCWVARACGKDWRPMFVDRHKFGLPDAVPVSRHTPTQTRVRVALLVLARVAIVLSTLWFVMPAIVLGVLISWPGLLIPTPLARRREIAADRTAAQITGAPATLAAALIAMSSSEHRTPGGDLRAKQLASAHAIVPFASSQNGRVASWLFDPHPPMKTRLAQLERLSRDVANS